MGHWNYRLLAFKDHEDILFEVAEVFYDDNGNPNGHGAASICGNSIDEIKADLKRFDDCLEKPILWGNDRFPEEYLPD